MAMAYKGRLAIIAGGFGGLGTATGRLLRAHGARLALLYAPHEASRRSSVLQSVYGSSSPSDISVHQCDITSESAVTSTFAEIDAAHSSTNLTPYTNTQRDVFPSILINAAGYVSVQALEDTTAEEALKNLIPNVLGPFLTSREFFKLYRSRARQMNGAVRPPPGRIVSLSSQASHVALTGHGPYCAAKAGLNGLTRCMANEWAQYGITANTVSPTVALTALGMKAWADVDKRASMLAQIPTGRFAEPEEIAEAVEFLCRDGSGMINGTDIRVDGGFTIR